ncbi:type VII secretion protein EccCa [Mycobacterium yunnanensis]|uniref:Type VII secretion protein EccCa n=2 Tax=Mycobacterium yunnanensis TaxID=368477 RepID=A0A9X3C2R9_9MYCO|nr:type VII secretion protein EccCa [Mycobacterium yunnanensis]
MRAAPAMPKDPPANLVAKVLPVVMLLAMGGMTMLYVTSGAASSRSPVFLFLPVMMLVSVLGSVAYQSRGARRGAELDDDRRAYLRYLDELDQTLARTAEAQHDSSHWSHPDPAAAWTLVGTARMWERRPGDEDFCHVRVGTGPRPLATTVVAPDASDARDPVLEEAVDRLLADRSTVLDVPVVVDLQTHARVAVLGPAQDARGVVRAMICQLTVLHGPDAVRVTATGHHAHAHWDWLKWLPHHGRPREGSPRARHVVIVDGGVDGTPGADTTISIGALDGECLSVTLDGTGPLPRPDSVTTAQALACARTLAPFRAASAVAARDAEWAQLVGVGDATAVDADRTWRPRSATERLRVAIGVTEDGQRVRVDLKEAARGGMGPHGLCVGATGSGKSEFLRTLVLGLVATHDPDALNVVLVDFKGGATFLGLERLRHVAAVVTNLSEEAHLVTRMRDALAGEMTRRQRVLRAAGGFPGIGDYDAARARGAELAPLPALFIVVDEFSELLSQHPDFAELFVAIGRLGRSLGMHLLLASQRLDEGRLRGLETHLSYRICLKTFSASESRAVLGTADAYELPGTPGAAILKTAAGELVRFRSAFVSGPVGTIAADEPEVARRFTAADAEQIVRVAPRPSRALLDVVVDRLADRGRAAHRVWLAPLAAPPRLDELVDGIGDLPPLMVPIGLVDNPFEQRRDPLMVDLRAAGGNVAIVGGPRSGKTSALRALVVALAATHHPEAMHVYGLDFGGGSSSSLGRLPHVGAFAGRQERDLARRIVTYVQGVVRERETRRPDGEARVADRPAVFLVVDGWAVARQEFDGMEEAVTAIAAQGLALGVHVVLTATRWAELRPALKDQLGTRIELCLGDPADSEMDRKRARLLGVRPPGHGITREGLEFVTALPCPDATDVAEVAARFTDRGAPAVRLLPALVPHAEVVDRAGGRVAIGLGEDDMAPTVLDFAAHPHLLILGDTECGKTATLRTLCREIVRVGAPGGVRLLVVDFRRTLLGVVDDERLQGYAMSAAAADAHVTTAAALLTGRLPDERVTQQQLRDRSWWSGPEVFVIVDDYDLVAGTSGNPLLPLLDLLPHARDLGLHLVIARRSGGAARAMFDPILARTRDLGCTGLMMSASADEGVLLGSVRPTPLPPGRGTLIRRGHSDQLVQVSWTDPQ